MSEKLSRSTPDFSQYDSMSIRELEEILRADAMGPERDDSDVDEIFYVMEVLAKKRRQNGIAGKTTLEAYQEFQQHHLPLVEVEKDSKSVTRRKGTVIPFRRLTTIAASLILVFTIATTANAFSFKSIWNAVARWAEETFSFSTGVEISEPKADNELKYESLQDALKDDDLSPDIVPTWIPDGYELIDIIIDRNPIQESYVAIYDNKDSQIKISVRMYLSTYPEQIEMSEPNSSIYSLSGVDYYLFSNHTQNRVAWIIDAYECYISGNIEVEELILMIESIGKG